MLRCLAGVWGTAPARGGGWVALERHQAERVQRNDRLESEVPAKPHALLHRARAIRRTIRMAMSDNGDLVPSYDAILPAGGTISDPLAARVGTNVKALIRFGGQTILERTLSAVRGSGLINRCVVIGGNEVAQCCEGVADEVLPEKGSGPENILAGLKYLLESVDPPQKVVVITTDLPFLSAEIVSQFISQCPKDRDICVPLVSRKDWDLRFPGSTATFATLADGAWTTGCAYLMDVGALQSAMPEIDRVFAARKSVLQMARLLGPAFLIKFLTRRLTTGDVESKIQSMLGCSGAAIRGAPTELAYDIDDLEDYEYAVRFSGGSGDANW